MDRTRAAHWQEAWAKAGIATGQRVAGHRKFYALVAYPGTSGFLHVGHFRGYAYADPLIRYHRMLGESVLFPFGIHASGLPAVTFAQRVAEGDPALRQQLDDHGVSAEERQRLEDPEAAARFLGEEYRKILRSIGALLDETTYLTTVDNDYRAFIRWQFRTLRKQGAVGQGAYFSSFCPVCGPVAVDPSETDLSSGGDAEVVRYTTVPFRLEDGRVLLAATLRPETVYGVTNLWLHPGAPLAVWHHGSGTFLVTKAGADRLVEQHGGHLGHEVPTSDLIGREVEVPFIHRSVPILAGGSSTLRSGPAS
jgi:leucyl-tRNA synthetase